MEPCLPEFDLRAFYEIEDKHRTRARWIAKFQERKQRVEKEEFERKQRQKIKLLEEKVNQGKDSDDSDEDQKKQSQEISDKVDALHQFQLLLPLAKTKIGEFFKAMTLIKEYRTNEVLR